MVKKVSNNGNFENFKIWYILKNLTIKDASILIGLVLFIFGAAYTFSDLLNKREIKIIKSTVKNYEVQIEWYRDQFEFISEKYKSLLQSTEQESPISPPTIPLPSDEVELIGEIVDTKNEPVSGAKISIRGSSVTYSKYSGEFKIRYKIGDTLNIKKEGYNHEKIRVTEDIKKLSVTLQKLK